MSQAVSAEIAAGRRSPQAHPDGVSRNRFGQFRDPGQAQGLSGPTPPCCACGLRRRSRLQSHKSYDSWVQKGRPGAPFERISKGQAHPEEGFRLWWACPELPSLDHKTIISLRDAVTRCRLKCRPGTHHRVNRAARGPPLRCGPSGDAAVPPGQTGGVPRQLYPLPGPLRPDQH